MPDFLSKAQRYAQMVSNTRAQARLATNDEVRKHLDELANAYEEIARNCLDMVEKLTPASRHPFTSSSSASATEQDPDTSDLGLRD